MVIFTSAIDFNYYSFFFLVSNHVKRNETGTIIKSAPIKPSIEKTSDNVLESSMIKESAEKTMDMSINEVDIFRNRLIICVVIFRFGKTLF